jgi:hypothetical protein
MEKITNISSTRNGDILRKIAKKGKLISLVSHEYLFLLKLLIIHDELILILQFILLIPYKAFWV